MRYYPMNEFLDDLFDSRVFTNRNVMKTDIYEKDGRFYLEIEVPGVKKEKLKVEMPITDALYKVLFEGKDAKKMVAELLERDKKAENY